MTVLNKKYNAPATDQHETAVSATSLQEPNEIGRGRSGIVYKVRNRSGDEIACKVFDSRGLTKIVQWVTLGAPNPYMWNADAVQCAKIRRNMLSLLVPTWTDGEVSVADADLASWNEDSVSFELHTHFVGGRPAALQHTLRGAADDEAADLWRRVMPDLRSDLDRAGFDGLLWQAGIGNPVALNNFLYEEVGANGKGGKNGRWVWIDLESGVPAIFPISPKVFFQYSFKHWWQGHKFLFDDVDIDRLNEYLQSEADSIERALGAESFRKICDDAALLEHHQEKWKSVGRLDSSIRYRLMRRDIDEAQAEYYLKHKLLWVFRESGRALQSSLSIARRSVSYLIRKIRNLRLLSKLQSGLLFLVSQKRREEFVHSYLEGCIYHWLGRGQISADQAEILRGRIGAPDSSVYITDFGIHLAIKPVIKGVQYLLLPGLFAMGVISGPVTAFLVVAGGAIARTAYTLGRIIQLSNGGHSRPWIALGVGVLPIVGNLAFPTQMLFSIRGENEILARFMLDDGFARIGRHLPIWGGQDTWTEHWFNRLPSKTVEYWALKWRAAAANKA